MFLDIPNRFRRDWFVFVYSKWPLCLAPDQFVLVLLPGTAGKSRRISANIQPTKRISTPSLENLQRRLQRRSNSKVRQSCQGRSSGRNL
jgi:hypothetical protein